MNKGDLEWAEEQFRKLSPISEKRAREIYAFEYGKAWSMEPLEHRRECVSRNAANTRLREYVENYTKSKKGIVSPPPLLKS